jgi:uncharacterized membrane protein (UPF0127 family)
MSEEAYITAERADFTAEVADTFLKRSWGLSFRTEGKMLFKFPNDTNANIDMMLLSEPLWLYFLNSNKEVIDIQKAEPWGMNPRTWRLYSPEEPYRYLIESFEKLDIEEGEKVRIDLD